MPGFDPNNPPIRPGFYSIIRAAVAEVVAPGTGAIACVIISHDYGPEATPVKVTSVAEFQDTFGTSATDDAFTIQGLLTGDGTPDGRASEVWVYRAVPTTAAGVAASKTLQNTTPAAAITLTAKYKGAFANGWRVTTRVHPTDAGYSQLMIFVGSLLVETWTYLTTDITGLAAMINATVGGSAYVVASAVTSGVALSAVSAVAFTGGSSGTYTSTDYTAAMTAVEGVAANHFLFSNMTDSVVLAAARTWIVNLNTLVRRAFLWTGGASAESISSAVTRSQLSNTTPEVVNAGGPNLVSDSDLTVVKSTAQFLGYFVGIGAGYGTRRSMTFARIPGWHTAVRSPDSEIKSGIRGGVLMATMDDDGLRIEKGITTFTSTGDATMPVAFYSDFRSVRIIHRIDTDLERMGRLFWIGLANNENSRAAYQGMVENTYFKGLENENVLKKGLSTFTLDPGQDNDDDTWYPAYSITRQRTVERILATGSIG